MVIGEIYINNMISVVDIRNIWRALTAIESNMKAKKNVAKKNITPKPPTRNPANIIIIKLGTVACVYPKALVILQSKVSQIFKYWFSGEYFGFRCLVFALSSS